MAFRAPQEWAFENTSPCKNSNIPLRLLDGIPTGPNDATASGAVSRIMVGTVVGLGSLACTH